MGDSGDRVMGGGGRYDGCHDGPTALEYGKLTCFPTKTMEVLQHHDSPWQPVDTALSPINLLLDFNLPNFYQPLYNPSSNVHAMTQLGK